MSAFINYAHESCSEYSGVFPVSNKQSPVLTVRSIKTNWALLERPSWMMYHSTIPPRPFLYHRPHSPNQRRSVHNAQCEKLLSKIRNQAVPRLYPSLMPSCISTTKTLPFVSKIYLPVICSTTHIFMHVSTLSHACIWGPVAQSRRMWWFQ